MNKIAIRECIQAVIDDIMDNIRDVNCGGCAVFAVELARRLRKVGANDFKIRVYSQAYTSHTDVSYVERVVSEDYGYVGTNEYWYENGVFFSHVRLEWDGSLWDGADGEIPADEGHEWNGVYNMHPGNISIQSMLMLCRHAENWNARFNRKQIPMMREIMTHHFNKLRDRLAMEQLPLAA